ncbi:unnamed protein product [Chironomus riparius]|uniref:NACHT domain-containing protein n=1 Tax=Chironomus riparius TaxID=315576 RepID=A0A9N9S7X7_9DIPT|nr:unnamed protein product [Chironomus riparius]
MSYFFSSFQTTKSQSFSNLKDAIAFLHRSEKKLFYNRTSSSYSKTLIIEEEELDENIDILFSNASFPHNSLWKPVVIAFKSLVGKKKCKIYWKNAENKYFVLEINSDKDENFADFCIYGVVNGLHRVKSDPKKKLTTVKLEDLSDRNKWNLLILAVKQNLPNVVQILLDYNFDINHEDYNCNNAMDSAWINYLNPKDDQNKYNSSKIMEFLLKANSKFPKTKLGFKAHKAPAKVRNALNLNKSLRDLMQAKSYDNLKKIIEENKPLHHFYDIKNKSILAHAYTTYNLEAIEALTLLELRFGGCEVIHDYYTKLADKDAVLIKDLNIKIGYRNPEGHINILLRKSRIGRNDGFSNDKWKSIHDAYQHLNSIPECSVILKIASMWKKLKIVFDFSHSSTSNIDPKTDEFTKGVVYDSGAVIIGAKYLMDEKYRLNVLGTLIHELYHCAMLVTFFNNYNPYPAGDSEAKAKYEIIFNRIKALCAKDKYFEVIIRNAFSKNNDKNEKSELIVRTLQILVQYSNDDRKIQSNKELLKDLFDYHEQKVLPACEEALLVLNKLNGKKIKFKELTASMKAKILHSMINFQGVETTFYDIFKHDPQKAKNVLNSLTIDDIRCFLFEDDQILEFFDSLEVDEIVERRLVDSSRGTLKCTLFPEVAADVEESKTFILADKAGAGKTAMMNKIAYDLKAANKSHFVAFIKLSDCYDILEQHQAKLSIIDIKALLIEIFKVKIDIEVAVLTYLYSASKIIFLFDGVDEIYPNLKDIFSKILKHLKENTKNQVWVSTRPHLVPQLKDQLQCKVYKLASLSKEEKDEFISTRIDKSAGSSHFTGLVKEIESSTERRVDNFYMIESIYQIFCSHKDILSINSSNFSEIFDKLIQLYANKVDQKLIPAKSIKGFNQEQVHQAVALENVSQKELAAMIQEMCIIKNWKAAQEKWLVDDIQRHGIITAECGEKSTEFILDFVHKIYAEYYVAQHILNFLYSPNYGIKKEEFEKVLNILRFIAGCKDEFKFIHKFLLSAAGSDDANDGIFETMKEVIFENMIDLQRDMNNNQYLNDFWAEIL